MLTKAAHFLSILPRRLHGELFAIIMSLLQYFHCVFSNMMLLEGAGVSPVNIFTLDFHFIWSLSQISTDQQFLTHYQLFVDSPNTESVQFCLYLIHSSAKSFLLTSIFLRFVIITTVLITSQRTAVTATVQALIECLGCHFLCWAKNDVARVVKSVSLKAPFNFWHLRSFIVLKPFFFFFTVMNECKWMLFDAAVSPRSVVS